MSDFQKSFEVKLDTKALDQIAANLDINVEAVLRMCAEDIASEAKILVSPLTDTGALVNSIYVASNKENVMPSVPGNPERVKLPTPEKGAFTVGPSVNYGEYIEFPGKPGGKRARWAGHPYMIPAFEHQAQRYKDPSLWKKVVEPTGQTWESMTDLSDFIPDTGGISDISNWTPE